MFKIQTISATLLLLATPALAEDRYFVFRDDVRNPPNLIAICPTAGSEATASDVVPAGTRMAMRKSLMAKAREMGFSDGNCASATKEGYEEMSVLVFTLGGAALYLTRQEIEEFRQVAGDVGRLVPFETSETWPPNE